MRQNNQLELALSVRATGEAPSTGTQGTEARATVADLESPAAEACCSIHRTAVYVIRMYGGVGGAGSRDSPLSRSGSKGQRDRSRLGPGSALHHFVLHRVRDDPKRGSLKAAYDSNQGNAVLQAW